MWDACSGQEFYFSTERALKDDVFIGRRVKHFITIIILFFLREYKNLLNSACQQGLLSIDVAIVMFSL